MKLIILIIQSVFLLFPAAGCVQADFKKDWAGFDNSDKWIIELSDGQSKYLDEPTLGYLIFKNKIDKKSQLTFVVFSKKQLNKRLKAKLKDWDTMQSCAFYISDFKDINNKKNTSSFLYKDFYYYLEPCDKCHSGEVEKECEEIANKLSEFISTKK